MNLANEFCTWARDPRRTNEELYLAELLIESGHVIWKRLNKGPWSNKDYDAMIAHSKRRLLNPAYRAKLSKEKLAHTTEVWAEIESVSNDRYNDRPVRDLSALRFFPHLTRVELRTELADLSGLSVLKALRVLDLRDERLADLSALADHPQLENLSLSLQWPWPALASVAKLPRLNRFRFDGNILALADVPSLPAVKHASLGPLFDTKTPLRDLEQAPAMPEVRELELHSTASLRGLERYARLENLKIEGPFSDISLLAELPFLHELTIKGERFSDLSPLARLPRLRTLELQRERGLDLTPLSESPSLREVKSKSEVLKTELATLNAALGFVDVSEFLATEPRPLRPLRFLSWRTGDPEFKALKRERRTDERIAFFGDDPVMKPAESRWFLGLLREKLNPFESQDWIKFLDIGSIIHVKLFRADEALSVRRMINAVRPLMAAARFRWEVVFDVELNGDPMEDEYESPNYDEFDVERQREDWEDMQQRQKEHHEMLEREHQLGLRQQQGVKVDPDAFSSETPEPQEGDKPDADKNFTAEIGEADDDEEDNRSFMIFLKGDYVWLHESDVEDATPFLRERPEDWHALPEPPEQRPYMEEWWD